MRKTPAKIKSTEIDILLETIIEGKEILKLREGTKVFSQGADADAVYFIQSGTVQVTIAWVEATNAVLAILGPGDFFGEGCLVGQSLRINTATTTESSTVLKIQKQAMLRAFHAQPENYEKFIGALIVRNMDIEEDICDQLFSVAEKRLARVLLKLDRYGRQELPSDATLSNLSHETLAELVGATRSEISRFLSKFKRLGLIHYNVGGEIAVNGPMLIDIVLPPR